MRLETTASTVGCWTSLARESRHRRPPRNVAVRLALTTRKSSMFPRLAIRVENTTTRVRDTIEFEHYILDSGAGCGPAFDHVDAPRSGSPRLAPGRPRRFCQLRHVRPARDSRNTRIRTCRACRGPAEDRSECGRERASRQPLRARGLRSVDGRPLLSPSSPTLRTRTVIPWMDDSRTLDIGAPCYCVVSRVHPNGPYPDSAVGR